MCIYIYIYMIIYIHIYIEREREIHYSYVSKTHVAYLGRRLAVREERDPVGAAPAGYSGKELVSSLSL